MLLTFQDADRRRLDQVGEGILLGIIQTDGTVRLREADALRVPGHADWLRLEPIEDVFRGFSLGVSHAHVTWMMPGSILNPTSDGVLEDDLVSQLKAMFPRSAAFRVLRS